MNRTGDIPPHPPLTNCATPDRPCGLTSIIPSLGMASCRGRAEAFARRLQSKLRTLGSQSDESPTNDDEETLGITSDESSNTWLASQKGPQAVTNLQPLRNDVESFFDFDVELESPGSPVDECEYSRLIETASNTPLGTSLSAGFVSASSSTTTDAQTNHSESNHSSSSEDPFFDPDTNVVAASASSSSAGPQNGDFYDCDPIPNGPANGLLVHVMPADGNETVPQFDVVDGDVVLPTTCIQAAILDDLHKQSLEVGAALQNGHLETEVQLPELQIPTQIVTSSENEDKPAAAAEEVATEPAAGQTNDDNDDHQHLSAPTTTTAAVDTEEEDDCRPQRVRRCSSLKTGKTPPGTPGRKKIVRFADALGLDLADVKTFLDEIPTIPKSAFEDLEISESEPPIQMGPKPEKLLMPLFQQPGGLNSFLDTVREKLVVLENAAVVDPISLTITGSVRVRNMDFHKSVHIRYTLDNWRSYADLQANYVQNSCDGFSDKFTFVLFGNSLAVGQRLEFAVRFQCKGQQFWDSNYGTNYCFQCLPASGQPVAIRSAQCGVLPASHHTSNGSALLSPGAGEAWCGSFY